MTQVWQLRESKQQRFIEELEREVRDAADASGNYEYFIIEFLIAILARFRFEIDWERGAVRGLQAGATWLLDGMVMRVAEFARVESERKLLLYKLFEKLTVVVAAWAQREYGHEQIMKPQEVYGVASATAELEEE